MRREVRYKKGGNASSFPLPMKSLSYELCVVLMLKLARHIINK